MDKADLQKLRKLHALLGSQNDNESANARRLILELLAKHRKSWNDLLDLLKKEDAHKTEMPHPLDLVARVLERYLHLTDAQRIALALWIAHTFIYARFSITPRLAFLSPVRGCGKSTALNLVKALSFNARKIDHTTPAVLFRIIDFSRACVLLDEVDNQDLPVNSALRSIINSGHHVDGCVTRYLDGVVMNFTTFAPLALAAIGRLPLPILHRSLIIRMERAAKSSQLERFDPKTKPEQHRMCDAVYGETLAWAQQTQFNADPAMPKGLRNRAADNWRVLFAVADACSQEWGKAARDAAIELSRGQDEDDMGVRLLADIRVIFDRGFPQDHLSSALLVEQLNDLPDGLWCEWRGPKDDGAPRKLSQGSLAMMLAPFGIRPRTIWPARRGVLGKSAKGYKRAQFESAWASYCDEGGTPSQPRNIRYLHDR